MNNNQLTEITFNVEDDYKCEIKEFTEDQKNKLDNLKVNMLVGHFIGIGADNLKRLEEEEKPFIIENKNKNYILIFQFNNGIIELKNILEYNKYVFN